MFNLNKILIIFVVATTISLAAIGREVLTAPPVATYLIAVNNIKAVKMQEIFKPIKGYEGLYEVSNFGRVKSLTRTNWNEGMKCFRERKGIILKQVINPQGYPMVGIYLNGIRTMKTVHRLVLTAFVENKQNKSTVNHKNGIKADNRIENLEWMTLSENQQNTGRVNQVQIMEGARKFIN